MNLPIHTIAAKIVTLPVMTFARTLGKLDQMLGDPKASTGVAACVLASDPVLTALVIGRANAASLQELTQVGAAMGVLGLATVHGLVRDTLPLREQTLEPVPAPGLPVLPTTSSVKPLFSGPLNLNSATREQIEALPGVGPVLAGRILAARPYRTLADLDAVKGVGETTLKRLEPYLVFR